MRPLEGVRVVSLAINLPGPLAAQRLHQLGASISKVEPPTGDPLEAACPDWYRVIHDGQQSVRLNLKSAPDKARLDSFLRECDLFLTSHRPSALKRLGLSWPELHERFPRLTQVAIVGYPSPDQELPGHDLAYQARLGLIANTAVELPRTVLADIAGAQQAVEASLGVILARERGQGSLYAEVSLADVAAYFAEPYRRGLTAPGGFLGGGLPGYNLYACHGDTMIAVAALEPHFWQRLIENLSLADPDKTQLQAVFLTRTASEWETWAQKHDLPIAAVRDKPSGEEESR